MSVDKAHEGSMLLIPDVYIYFRQGNADPWHHNLRDQRSLRAQVARASPPGVNQRKLTDRLGAYVTAKTSCRNGSIATTNPLQLHPIKNAKVLEGMDIVIPQFRNMDGRAFLRRLRSESCPTNICHRC